MKNDNKLIAEFMGVTPTDNWYDGYELHKAGFPFNYGAMGNGTTEPKFTTSWDWLMPVVEKILNLDLPESGFYENYIDVWAECRGIDGVYSVVVEFIKWYNKREA